MNIKWWLYKKAVNFIGKCNEEYKDQYTLLIRDLDRLTYRSGNQAYLLYGADHEWMNFSKYEVIQNAINKLADLEDQESEVKRVSYPPRVSVNKRPDKIISKLRTGNTMTIKEQFEAYLYIKELESHL